MVYKYIYCIYQYQHNILHINVMLDGIIKWPLTADTSQFTLVLVCQVNYVVVDWE